jgi:predicted acylesterase/phospholipase RssA
MAGVGIVMSGGGHRAAMFGLGALLYLADAGKNRQVTSIASVSGGSLTNGYVALKVGYAELDGAGFERAMKPYARQIAQRGTVWAVWTTWAYLAVLALWLGGTVAIWWLGLNWAIRLLLFLIALLVWAKLAEQRGRICGMAFAKTLYSSGGKPPRLREIHSGIDHVLCATDLHAGEHVYFSGAFVCSYRFGWGDPADLPLHTAVQCSAALPGAFAVRWLRTKAHAFQEGTERAGTMALVDGGVYDNMADQWGSDVADRKDRWKGLADGLHEPEELVVVNASGGMSWGSVAALRIPLLGEILAMLRDKDVLYDNTTSLRRKGLVGRFDRAVLQGKGLRGALVHIPQSPFKVARDFQASTVWPDRQARAQAVLAWLQDEDEARWEELARASRGVKTALSKLGTDRSAALLRHGYLLAMANLHVILNYPLMEVPPVQRFVDLVS